MMAKLHEQSTNIFAMSPADQSLLWTLQMIWVWEHTKFGMPMTYDRASKEIIARYGSNLQKLVIQPTLITRTAQARAKIRQSVLSEDQYKYPINQHSRDQASFPQSIRPVDPILTSGWKVTSCKSR